MRRRPNPDVAFHFCNDRWYTLRWRIEGWHRVLKSGCRIEGLAHQTAERLKRAIAINLMWAGYAYLRRMCEGYLLRDESALSG